MIDCPFGLSPLIDTSKKSSPDFNKRIAGLLPPPETNVIPAIGILTG